MSDYDNLIAAADILRGAMNTVWNDDEAHDDAWKILRDAKDHLFHTFDVESWRKKG